MGRSTVFLSIVVAVCAIFAILYYSSDYYTARANGAPLTTEEPESPPEAVSPDEAPAAEAPSEEAPAAEAPAADAPAENSPAPGSLLPSNE